MTTLAIVLDPNNPTAPVPPNLYEFGISPAPPAEISQWQTNNVFKDLPDGVYYWMVRDKATHEEIRSGFKAIYSTDIEKIIQTQGMLANLNSRRELTVTANGQAAFNIGQNEDRTVFWVNGNRVPVSTYTIVNGVLTWNGPFSLKTTYKLELSY